MITRNACFGRSEIVDIFDSDQSVYIGILKILSKYVLCELKRTNETVVLSTHKISYGRKEKQYYFSQYHCYSNSFRLKLLVAQSKKAGHMNIELLRMDLI